MYRLTVDDKENYILVMRNILSSKLKIHSKYEVKVKRKTKQMFEKKSSMNSLQGSTVDRSASDKEKQNPCPTLKDNDFLEARRTVDLGIEQKRVFMEKLKRDVNVKEKQLFSSDRISFPFLILVSRQST